MKHNIITRQLENGVTLVMVPIDGVASCTINVLMGVGSRYESDRQQGLAHFTEHMVFKGGIKYKSTQEIAQAIDAVGGEFNAYTSHEFTGFYTKVAAEFLELGMDVISDMVLHATFPEEELVKEKGVIVEEINMYEDMPMRKVEKEFMQLVFGDTPVGRAILGTKNSVTAFTREDFLKYREQFYMGSKCVVAIAGSFDPEAILDLAGKYFSELPQGQTYSSEKAQILPKSDLERIKICHKKTEQTHFVLGVEALSLADPEKYTMRVLATILGGNMSSRLFLRVREEQGLCYYVRAMPDSYTDVGLLTVAAGVDNVRLDKAVEAVVKELKDMAENPVGEEELKRAKNFLVGKGELAMEDTEQVAEFYGLQQVLENETTNLDEMQAKTLQVTAEAVQKLARQIFTNDRLRLAVVGPQEGHEILNQILSI